MPGRTWRGICRPGQSPALHPLRIRAPPLPSESEWSLFPRAEPLRRGPALPWTHCWVSRANPPGPWAQNPWLASRCPESSEKGPRTRVGTRGIPPLVGAESCAPSGQTSLVPRGRARRTDRLFTVLPCRYPKLKGRKDDARLLSSEIKTTQEYTRKVRVSLPAPSASISWVVIM